MTCGVFPALWDLQVNGGWGVSFSDPGLSAEQVVALAEQYVRLGVGKFCPTLITAPVPTLTRSLRVIADACRANAWVGDRIAGIHLEGPWLSPLDGFRGAHPADWMREASINDFEKLQNAADGHIAIVTLAPEVVGALELVAHLTAHGVVAAIGHSAADAPTIDAAIDAGARLSTHLGNGIATPLPRHPNAIWQQAADDRLCASFIADLEHVDAATLRVLTRAKGLERTILVSDLSPLAGLPAGRQGDWEVSSDGSVRVAGTPYLAGAARPLLDGVRNLVALGWPIQDALRTATRNPARLLGHEVIDPLQNSEADRITLDHAGNYRLVSSTIGGRDFTPSQVVKMPGPVVLEQSRE